jgi:hypothetical protein
MSVYRITEFTSPDMSNAAELTETVRGDLANVGAESIDIVSVGDGKGLVVAKYPSQAAMEAATDIQKQVFGKMIAAGAINADSISVQSGEVIFSL